MSTARCAARVLLHICSLWLALSVEGYLEVYLQAYGEFTFLLHQKQQHVSTNSILKWFEIFIWFEVNGVTAITDLDIVLVTIMLLTLIKSRGAIIVSAYFSLIYPSLTNSDIAGVGNNEVVRMYLLGIMVSFQIKSTALKRTRACYLYT